jgi:hypothetical protein
MFYPGASGTGLKLDSVEETGKQENFLVQDAFSCDYCTVLCAFF